MAKNENFWQIKVVRNCSCDKLAALGIKTVNLLFKTQQEESHVMIRNFNGNRFPTLVGLIAAAVTLASSSLVLATSYSAATDFSATSNPTTGGIWRYGSETYSAGLPDVSTFATYATNSPQGITGGTLDLWHTGGIDPNVTHNGNAVTISCCGGNNITWSPGEMSIGPNPSTLSVVRFTAPTTAVYELNSSFIDNQDGGDSADVYVYKSTPTNITTPLFSSFAGTLVNSGVSFSLTGLALTAGDRVDFIVGPGADNNPTGNHTQLIAALATVPEPSTIMLFGLGGLGLYWTLRRRA